MKANYLLLMMVLVLSSCISYDAETEKKFQENRAFMESYRDEIGMRNSPFWELVPVGKLDKQRKKAVALMSKEEIKRMIDNKTRGLPRIKEGTERSEAFFRAIEDIEDQQKIYELLTTEYPDIIE